MWSVQDSLAGGLQGPAGPSHPWMAQGLVQGPPLPPWLYAVWWSLSTAGRLQAGCRLPLDLDGTGQKKSSNSFQHRLQSSPVQQPPERPAASRQHLPHDTPSWRVPLLGDTTATPTAVHHQLALHTYSPCAQRPARHPSSRCLSAARPPLSLSSRRVSCPSSYVNNARDGPPYRTEQHQSGLRAHPLTSFPFCVQAPTPPRARVRSFPTSMPALRCSPPSSQHWAPTAVTFCSSTQMADRRLQTMARLS